MSAFFSSDIRLSRDISDALIVALFTINFSLARTRAYLRKSTRQMSELRERSAHGRVDEARGKK